WPVPGFPPERPGPLWVVASVSFRSPCPYDTANVMRLSHAGSTSLGRFLYFEHEAGIQRGGATLASLAGYNAGFLGAHVDIRVNGMSAYRTMDLPLHDLLVHNCFHSSLSTSLHRTQNRGQRLYDFFVNLS